jgi:hypothetical protein
MNTPFKIIVVLLFLIISKTNTAQVESIPYYDNLNFHGSFIVIAESNDHSNFYVVDLNQFGTLIEKKYFEDLAFKEKQIVRIDAGNTSAAWFKVNKSSSITEISALFNTLKTTTINAVSSMDEAQKQSWFNDHSK